MEQEITAQTSEQTKEKLGFIDKLSAFVDRNYTMIFAGIITAFIYFLASFMYGVYPFGNRYTAASYDLSAQICPFIEHVFDVFEGKSSLFYSYAIAGGADVCGTFLYFFISPFSLLFLLFGDGMVAHTSAIVIGLKLATIAIVGTWFAKKQFSAIPDYLCIIVGIVYAYCGYTFVSNTYINWMDFLIYLPFAIAAFIKFVQTGKFWTFSILVACCIYTCFSIACFSMFLAFPILVGYGLICVEKSQRKIFLTRLCVAFVVAIVMALPVLLPALAAYTSSGRTGGLFENFWYGFSFKSNGEISAFNKEYFLEKVTEAAYRKWSYIFSDTAFLALTVIWFIRTRLKTPFSKFMLLAGVITLIPVAFDEAMLLMNMGSYMSYALRFGFLNAVYLLGGACLGLDGICYTHAKAHDGTQLKCIPLFVQKTDEEENKTDEGKPNKKAIKMKDPICGSFPWLIVFAVIAVIAFFFLLWFITSNHFINFWNAVTDNSTILEGMDGFASSYAHSLGGFEVIIIPCIVVLVAFLLGALLIWRKQAGVKLISYFLVALVCTQVVFYNNQLVVGNSSTQHVDLGAFQTLSATLNEMNTDDEGKLEYFRIKDYGDELTATAPFTGETNSFSVFSSVIDADNFIIGELFGYEGNFKNTLKSAHNWGKGNRSDEFGDSFLGYKYILVREQDKKGFDENEIMKKYVSPLMVKNEQGEDVHLSSGEYYIYENEIVFPTAFKVEDGEYRFVKPNEGNSDYRASNQRALYEFLRGKTLEEMRGPTGSSSSSFVTPETARELSEYLWDEKAATNVDVGAGKIRAEVTASAGECLMLSFVASDGYRVFVNGKETQLVDNDLKFLCVQLEEGENVVEFVYKSPYGKHMLVGLLFAVLGLAAIYLLVEKTKAVEMFSTLISRLGIFVAVAVTVFFMLYPTVVSILKWLYYLL